MNAWLEARYADAKKAYEAFIKHYPFQLEDLRGEIWKDILHYEGLYQVSTFGRVKSFVRYPEGKIMKPYLNKYGYLYVNLYKDGKMKHFRINRIVALAFIPNPFNLPEVDHRFNMRFDNSIWNLRWATHEENTLYAYETGAIKSGEENPRAKLTNEQVEYIRENPDGLTGRQLAEKFGVRQAALFTNQNLNVFLKRYVLKFADCISREIKNSERGHSQENSALSILPF